MSKFNIYKAKPGDVFYELNTYYKDHDLCAYTINEYLIYSISNTNEKDTFILDTSNGKFIYKNTMTLYTTYNSAKNALIKTANRNIREIKKEYIKRIKKIKYLIL